LFHRSPVSRVTRYYVASATGGDGKVPTERGRPETSCVVKIFDRTDTIQPSAFFSNICILFIRENAVIGDIRYGKSDATWQILSVEKQSGRPIIRWSLWQSSVSGYYDGNEIALVECCCGATYINNVQIYNYWLGLPKIASEPDVFESDTRAMRRYEGVMHCFGLRPRGAGVPLRLEHKPVPSRQGPRVRISLPPAASRVRTPTPRSKGLLSAHRHHPTSSRSGWGFHPQATSDASSVSPISEWE
jgi:hypothetical protein